MERNGGEGVRMYILEQKMCCKFWALWLMMEYAMTEGETLREGTRRKTIEQNHGKNICEKMRMTHTLVTPSVPG